MVAVVYMLFASMALHGVGKALFVIAAVILAGPAIALLLNRRIVRVDERFLIVTNSPIPWGHRIKVATDRLERILIAHDKISHEASTVGMARTIHRYAHVMGIVDGRRVRLIENLNRPATARFVQEKIQAWLGHDH